LNHLKFDNAAFSAGADFNFDRFCNFIEMAFCMKSERGSAICLAADSEKKFEIIACDESAFKSGSTLLRGTMASDLIKTRQLVGVSLESVQLRLGESTGYFWTDRIPAYLLNEGWVTDSDVGQLVFLPGRDGKVGDIVINKNCCEPASH
jgi:hypothetical protein